MKIEKARKQDFAELMDLMHRAFSAGGVEHDRFEELYPDLYQPTSESMSCNYLIRTEGKIASVAGVFPLAVRIGDTRLSIAGVGGVCTDPRHRGKGGMTALMNRVVEHIRGDGFALGWLTSERDRYARFGWEKAGSETVVQFLKPRPQDRALHWKVADLNPVRDSLDAVLAARDALEVKGLCDDETLRLKLRRKHMQVWQASLGSAFAYVVVNRKFQWLAEWGGDPEGIRALLNHVMTQVPLLNIAIPRRRDRYASLWQSVAQQYGKAVENLAVFDLLGVLKAYKPYFAEAWPRSQAVHLVATDGEKTLMSAGITDGKPQARAPRGAFTVRLPQLRMVSFLFGPHSPSFLLDLPSEARWLDQVFPLPFTMPSLWRV